MDLFTDAFVFRVNSQNHLFRSLIQQSILYHLIAETMRLIQIKPYQRFSGLQLELLARSRPNAAQNLLMCHNRPPDSHDFLNVIPFKLATSQFL